MAPYRPARAQRKTNRNAGTGASYRISQSVRKCMPHTYSVSPNHVADCMIPHTYAPRWVYMYKHPCYFERCLGSLRGTHANAFVAAGCLGVRSSGEVAGVGDMSEVRGGPCVEGLGEGTGALWASSHGSREWEAKQVVGCGCRANSVGFYVWLTQKSQPTCYLQF